MVVPARQKLDVESEFTRDLFNKRLPTASQHTLIFSFKGDGGFIGKNHDGTVSLESQLRAEAQSGATRVWGVNENHTEVLKSAKTAEYTKNALIIGQ